MSQSKNNSFRGEGCGAIGVVQIIFIVLKLCAPKTTIYKWSWIKVLIPLWISFGFCGCFCIAAFIAGIYLLCINVFNMYNDETKDLENSNTVVTMNTTNETPLPIDEIDLSSGV